MPDRRILLIGCVSLVKGRVKDAGFAMSEICNELEPTLKKMEFTQGAPFHTISLILRFGDKSCLVPSYERINSKHSELPVAIELEMSKLRVADRDSIKAEFVRAVKIVLVDVAAKYNLDLSGLESALGISSIELD